MKPLFLAVLLLAGTASAQEDKALAILKSDAPLPEKAWAFRELAHLGTAQAVPVLAPLLADETLSHLARYALEPIPDPSVDAALRDALGRLQGRRLAGVIHSLGVRRDPQAVAPLAKFLTDPDPVVAQAAARALGNLGGAAVPALERALSADSPTLQPAVCEGLLRCAESMPAADAVALYDRLRTLPHLPQHARVAAWWGASRSRGAEAVPRLVEALRTGADLPAADAIRMLTDLPGPEVTQVLAAELARANPDQRTLLMQALGIRGDVSAAPALVPLAQQGPAPQRIAAIRSLVQLGYAPAIPVLRAAAKDAEATVASAALAGLTGFPGREADAALVALVDEAPASLRVVCIDAAAQRRVAAVRPALLQAAGEAEVEVASASFKALGELADAADLAGVVDALLRTKALAAGETALAAICARQTDPSSCSASLLPGLARAQGEPKLALLRVLGGVGDRPALNAVRAAAGASDATVRETAQRVLCDWPTAEVLPDLAQLARTSTDSKFAVLALRGQLRLIPSQSVPDAQKVAQLKEVLPRLDRPEEQRLALATLGRLPSAESLALVVPYLSRAGLTEEASDAAVTIAEQIVDRHPAEVGQAMKQVQTGNAKLAERARQLLARPPGEATEAGFTSMFNGKDLSGWSGKPGGWTVEEGALTAESTPEKPCREAHYLVWRGGEPADFELLADFKISASGNSGIQVRSEERPHWDTFGYQADLTGNGELVGFVYHHARGLIAGRGESAVFAADGQKRVEPLGDPAELLKHFRPNDWNTYRIVCRGPSITLAINGALMCRITDHHATQAAARGLIALQMHPGPPMKVQFKNLRLREMK